MALSPGQIYFAMLGEVLHNISTGFEMSFGFFFFCLFKKKILITSNSKTRVVLFNCRFVFYIERDLLSVHF